jgi:predicted phosphodiesterase
LIWINMLIALLTDIHGNREAFDACRAEARRLGAERLIYLGDLVGYGADPAYVVDRVAEDFAQGAISLMGNHDLAAVEGPSGGMHDMARAAIEWTSDQLGVAQKAFLAAMPYTASTVSAAGAETLYVHGEASAPRRFIYVTGRTSPSARSMRPAPMSLFAAMCIGPSFITSHRASRRSPSSPPPTCRRLWRAAGAGCRSWARSASRATAIRSPLSPSTTMRARR